MDESPRSGEILYGRPTVEHALKASGNMSNQDGLASLDSLTNKADVDVASSRAMDGVSALVLKILEGIIQSAVSEGEEDGLDLRLWAKNDLESLARKWGQWEMSLSALVVECSKAADPTLYLKDWEYSQTGKGKGYQGRRPTPFVAPDEPRSPNDCVVR